jgi:DNA-binding LytR/AlgR family response regulator
MPFLSCRYDEYQWLEVDYLLKPLDPEQVAKAVNRLLAYLSLNFLESVLDRSDAASSKGRTLTADNSLRIELAN